jgi:hypothetical protein
MTTQKSLDTVKALSSEYMPTVEEDQPVGINGV